MATTTTSTVVAFVLGAAAGTGGTIAATYSGDASPNVVCEYDAAVDAIMCKVAPIATTEAAPVPVNQ